MVFSPCVSMTRSSPSPSEGRGRWQRELRPARCAGSHAAICRSPRRCGHRTSPSASRVGGLPSALPRAGTRCLRWTGCARKRSAGHGDELMQQIQTLRGHLGRDNRHPRSIAARPRQTLHQTRRHRVARRETIGNRTGAAITARAAEVRKNQDEICLRTHKLSRARPRVLDRITDSAPFDNDVLAFNIALLAERIAQILFRR